MNSVNFISENVRGLRDRTKRLAIFNWIKSMKGVVVMMQETYSTPRYRIGVEKGLGRANVLLSWAKSQ